MSRYLTILEVSGKQNYIFSSNKLKDNVHRSAEIAYMTSRIIWFMRAADTRSWSFRTKKVQFLSAEFFPAGYMNTFRMRIFLSVQFLITIS